MSAVDATTASRAVAAAVNPAAVSVDVAAASSVVIAAPSHTVLLLPLLLLVSRRGVLRTQKLRDPSLLRTQS